MKDKSCILFDLDNTLVGIHRMDRYIREIMAEYLKIEFNIIISDKISLHELLTSGKNYVYVLKKWGIEQPETFWHKFDTYDYKKRQILLKTGKLKLYSDVEKTLQLLRNQKFTLGVVSNTADFVANWEVEAFGIKNYFSIVRGLGDNQEDCKPEAAGILKVLKTLEKKPEETLFVGDYLSDIMGSFNSNIDPVWIIRESNFHGDFSKDTFIDRIKNDLIKYKLNIDDVWIISSLDELVVG